MTGRQAVLLGASRRRWLSLARPISIRPGASTNLPRGFAHHPSSRLVVLVVVQFVISCFLALILGQHHLNPGLMSHAIPTFEATSRQAPEQDRGAKLMQFGPIGRDKVVANEVQRVPQVAFLQTWNIDRRADELADMLREKPRWRLNPSTSSATGLEEGRQTAVRHNRFLTVEDLPTTGDSGVVPEHGLITQESALMGAKSDRKRRDQRQQQQQQQATGPNPATDKFEKERRHNKTLNQLLRAEQAYLNKLNEIRQRYLTNRAITDRAYYILLIIYAILITFGTISNSLIFLTVIFKPKILSPRNLFIVNLAGSDLLLCVFTMPLTFIEISMKIWQMGLIPCKLVAGLQATSIFVSTISITAIALDRYKVIVFPTHQETASGTRGALLLLASVWIGALVISLPLFTYRTVEHHAITSPTNQSDLFPMRPSNGLTPDSGQSAHPQDHAGGISSGGGGGGGSGAAIITSQAGNQPDAARAPQLQHQLLTSSTLGPGGSGLKHYPNQLVSSFDFCIEDWPFAHGRGIFSVVSMVLQYVLPISIVSFVYTKISRKLQKRLIRRQRLTQLECQQKRQLNLIKRTHTMLVSVSLVFGFSWLPLNLWNVASDFSAGFRQFFDDQTFRIIFAICHLIGCSSACSNPILYGFLNENFRKELQQVYNQHARLLLRRLTRLLDWLNQCWLMRRLFSCCGVPVEMRGDDEAGDESEEDREGKTKRSAMKKSAMRHLSRRAPTSSAHYEDLETDVEPHQRQHPAESISSYSSNFFTDYDEDDDSGSAFCSEPSGSPTSEGDVLVRVPSLRVGVTSFGKLSTSPNAIPLSFMNLECIDKNLGRTIGACRDSSKSNRAGANRPRAESTPCSEQTRDLPDGIVRRGVPRAPAGAQLIPLRMGQPARRSLLGEPMWRKMSDQVARTASDPFDKDGDNGARPDERDNKLAGTTTLQMADLKSQSRRLSYQTIISVGRDDNRTIGGRAMRLCLCISSSSSTDTMAGVAASPRRATANGFDQSSIVIADGLSDARGAIDRVTSVANRIDGAAHRKRQRRRQRRKRWHQINTDRPAQLKCECQCHRAEKLPPPADHETRSLCEPARAGRLENGSKTPRAQCQAATLTGRRVWLRFLGSSGAGRGAGAPDSDETRLQAATMGDGRLENGQHRDSPQIRLYAHHIDPAGQVTEVGQTMHRSQSDLLMRLAERKAIGVSRDEADDSASLRPNNEKNQSSGTANDTSKPGREHHCSSCKHSSVSSAPATLLPVSATGHRRRLKRRRANQGHRSVSVRRHKSQAADAGRDLASHGASPTSRLTRRMRRMQVEQPSETGATKGVVEKTKPTWSISSWISGLRRKRSGGGSKLEADMDCVADNRGGGGGGGGGNISNLSETRSTRQRSEEARSGGSGSGNRATVAAAKHSSKQARSVSPSSIASNNKTPATQASNAGTRNNLHHQQTPSLIIGGPAQSSSPVTTLDPGGAQAMRQVGTVYLSIEMNDSRKRADSIFSFDGVREKSTSVVVMMADDEDEVDACGDDSRPTEPPAASSRTSQAADLRDGKQLNANERQPTRSTSAAEGLRNGGRSKTSDRVDDDGEQQTGQPTQVVGADNRGERGISPGPAAATAQDDNFIDSRPAGPQFKLARAGGIDDSKLQSNNNQSSPELGKSGGQIGNDVSVNNCAAPPSPPTRAVDMAAETAAPVATSTQPITVRSSNSSGSVSPSALSFTSACLLHHSSSISSCTCSLTTSSFSSGQLTATHTTTATTRESSMSISTQATLSINVSPRNSVPQHQHQDHCHNQNAANQHGHHQHHFQLQTRHQQAAPKAAALGLPVGGPAMTTTTIRTMNEPPSGDSGATRRHEPLAWHRSESSGSSRAAPSCGRHRNQGQLELRQSRTHSATLGSDLGRTARAARAAASAAARYKSLKAQVAFDGSTAPADCRAEDEVTRCQLQINPTRTTEAPVTSIFALKTVPSDSTRLSSFSVGGSGLAQPEPVTKLEPGVAAPRAHESKPMLSTGIVLAESEHDTNCTSPLARIESCRADSGSSRSLAVGEDAKLKTVDRQMVEHVDHGWD